jgi:hypothetical protein
MYEMRNFKVLVLYKLREIFGIIATKVINNITALATGMV